MLRTIAIEEHFRSRAFLAARAAGLTGEAGEANPMVPRVAARLEDVDAGRLADMDAAGVAVQVVSHNVPGPEVCGPREAVYLAREMNDELAAAVRAHPDRLAGFAMLPTPEPEAAAGELRRAVAELGLVGAMVHGTTGGRFLDDRFFWPIFAEAERLRVPVYLHPAPPPPAVRDAYYSGLAPDVGYVLATSAWGWHVETGLHALRLVLAGVFDRHPELQVVIGHMGEAVPFLVARADAVLGRFAKGLERPVRDYFARNFHYTTSALFSRPPLDCLLAMVGPERVLFAVDYPFSDGVQAREFFESLPLAPSDRERIAHGNAEALLRI
jgi:predicted TIM-barrel fold metal-dependent hydrolase